jgi:hypothetical protein
MKKIGKTCKELEKVAKDRANWRRLILALCATWHEMDR